MSADAFGDPAASIAWPDESTPIEDPVIGRTAIPTVLLESVARHADRPAQHYKGGVYDRSLAGVAFDAAPRGAYASLSYDEMGSIVRTLAAGFRSLGLTPGDRVVLQGHTRLEWALVDVALLAVGVVVVPMYGASPPGHVRHVIDDARPTGAIVEGPGDHHSIASTTDLSFLLSMDTDTAEGAREHPASLADVFLAGDERTDRGDGDAETDVEGVVALEPGSLATIIYTSGTTGEPKGVRLTHRNLRANLNQIRHRFGPFGESAGGPGVGAGDRALSFLPLAHVFERMAGHFFLLASGASVAYAESPSTLEADLAAIRPTVMTAVPAVLERIHDRVRQEVADDPLKDRLLSWALEVADRQGGDGPTGPRGRVERAVADRLVFRRIRAGLGGNLELLISGGGRLSPALCRRFHGAGVPVVEGYGLTETAPVVAVNPPNDARPGSIGPPVVDCAVRLDSSAVDVPDGWGGDEPLGELLVCGPNVFDGYWERPVRSAAAFTDDGWFRTGDIVARDADGFLTFVTRRSNVIVLSSGWNVAPEPLEATLEAEAVIDQCVVLGDDERWLGALIVPDIEAVRRWADRTGRPPPADRLAMGEDDDVRRLIENTVERHNRDRAPYERIERVSLVPERFTVDNGMLTPSMKKQRGHIRERFAVRVSALFDDEG